jgi:hypothetical protein
MLKRVMVVTVVTRMSGRNINPKVALMVVTGVMGVMSILKDLVRSTPFRMLLTTNDIRPSGVHTEKVQIKQVAMAKISL